MNVGLIKRIIERYTLARGGPLNESNSKHRNLMIRPKFGEKLVDLEDGFPNL